MQVRCLKLWGGFVNLADYIRREFSYNSWANQEVVNAIATAGTEDKRSVQLLAHIFAAERLWLQRLKQQPQSTPVWPELDLKRCQDQLDGLGKLWNEYLELITAGDIMQTVSYKNSKGESWTSSIVDVLTHVVMHSAYHRGQIASHMRESGRTPAYTDFIHSIRQGFVE
jgi:uncharacterized damage-inducible protein DinB